MDGAPRGEAGRNTGRLNRPDGELLAELALAHGVTISDIAAALHVRVAEVRGWRNGQATVPTESLHALSDFAAFVGRLATVVDSPGRWLSAPLVAGFNVTALDVYTRDRAAILQQLAAGAGELTATGVLDDMAPGWRQQWRSRYRVFTAADGELSMQPRA